MLYIYTNCLIDIMLMPNFLYDGYMITVQTSLQGNKKTCLNQCPRILYFSSKNEKEDRWPNNISYSNKMLWKFLRRLLPPIWGSIVVTKATLCTLTIFCYSSIIRKMKKCWSVYFVFNGMISYYACSSSNRYPFNGVV